MRLADRVPGMRPVLGLPSPLARTGAQTVSDYEALAVVIVIIAVVCWLLRGGIWRRCRCGAMYCNSCNRRK